MGETFYANVNGTHMTVKQHEILCLLRETHRGQQPPVKIENINGHSTLTLRLLCQRDWIVPAWKMFDEERYAITGRGMKALEKAESLRHKPPKGNLCYRCGIAPRHVYPTGRRVAYCQSCQKDVGKEHYARRRTNYKPGLCSTCGLHPRVVTASGYVYRCCQDCKSKDAVANNRRRAERLQLDAAAGQIRLCGRCGSTPIHVTPSTPNLRCKACVNVLRRQRRRAFKMRRMAEKMGLRKS